MYEVYRSHPPLECSSSDPAGGTEETFLFVPATELGPDSHANIAATLPSRATEPRPRVELETVAAEALASPVSAAVHRAAEVAFLRRSSGLPPRKDVRAEVLSLRTAASRWERFISSFRHKASKQGIYLEEEQDGASQFSIWKQGFPACKDVFEDIEWGDRFSRSSGNEDDDFNNFSTYRERHEDLPCIQAMIVFTIITCLTLSLAVIFLDAADVTKSPLNASSNRSSGARYCHRRIFEPGQESRIAS
ncbi:hypothetical protein MRX96_005504 [Rhipicephalus microplus]